MDATHAQFTFTVMRRQLQHSPERRAISNIFVLRLGYEFVVFDQKVRRLRRTVLLIGGISCSQKPPPPSYSSSSTALNVCTGKD